MHIYSQFFYFYLIYQFNTLTPTSPTMFDIEHKNALRKITVNISFIKRAKNVKSIEQSDA
jgi:hypothetical protein